MTKLTSRMLVPAGTLVAILGAMLPTHSVAGGPPPESNDGQELPQIIFPGTGVGDSKYSASATFKDPLVGLDGENKKSGVGSGVEIGGQIFLVSPDTVNPGASAGGAVAEAITNSANSGINWIVVPGTGVGGSPYPSSTPRRIIVRGNQPGFNFPDSVIQSLPTGSNWIVVPITGVGGNVTGNGGTHIVPNLPSTDDTAIQSSASVKLPPSSSYIIVPDGNGQVSQDIMGETEHATAWTSASSAEIASKFGTGVSDLGFLDLDSGLRDCDIPFDQLAKKSPFCQGPQINGQMCQRFSYSQFPEAVRIVSTLSDGRQELCSGTMIASDWVLTAAHCFIEDQSVSSILGTHNTRDLVLTSNDNHDLVKNVTVEAANAKIIPQKDRVRVASKVIINKSYSGNSGESDNVYLDDLALVKLNSPFPPNAVMPARLAGATEFSADTTIAGYGYSNVAGGTLGSFQLTFPAKVSKDESTMSFVPGSDDGAKSAFCQGDSGGPVYAGRFRGCKPYDVSAELLPRPVQGVISFNKLGNPDTKATGAMWHSSRCISASKMVMQDITTVSHHNWICRGTAGNAFGCDN